jgi:peptide/nickel transport system substrate-binding protein
MNSPRRTFSRLIDSLLAKIEVQTPSDKFILRVLFFIVLFSGVWFVVSINNHFSSVTPIRGGTLTEGIVGTPRFINPALAITRVDQDVTTLVYSGLLRLAADGALVPDLAESITVSDDGLTYNIILKKDARFHDYTPLTAKDVAFTIGLIQNPDLKSPLRGNWNDVTVEVISDTELNMVLRSQYPAFQENFLVGIMPEHLWSTVPIEQIPFSELNTKPVGSGSFAVERTVRDQNGLINSYTLVANKRTFNPPKIDNLELRFYNYEAALITDIKNGTLDASAYVANENLAEVLEDGDLKVISEPLPRVFGIFFNQNKAAALRDAPVREALSVATDRDNLIATALKGNGVPIVTPMPSGNAAVESGNGSNDTETISRTDKAKKILTDAGWVLNSQGLLEKQIDGTATILSLTIRTSNTALFDTVSQMIADDWKAIGVDVSIEQFEQTGLVQTVIRPRDFEALLFGLDMSRSADLYPFWHSSQKNDPGLNIAQYTNLSVDTLLEKARTERDETIRNSTLREVSVIIENERPAVFLFEPMMTYVVKKQVVTSDMKHIGKPSDRFSNIADWYTATDKLWNIFKINN